MKGTNYTDDDIWFWYSHHENIKKLNIGTAGYCRRFQIEYKKLINFKYRLVFKSESNPVEYERLILEAQKFKESGLSKMTYCKTFGVVRFDLDDTVRHLRYKNKIDKLSKENALINFVEPPPAPMKNKEQKMTFKKIAMGEIPLPFVKEQEMIPANIAMPEVLEKQNDIEITITKGVKVCIEPGIDSMKILKIIELLKDL